MCSHFDALNTKKVLLILSFQLRSFELGSFTKLVKIKMVLLYCIVDFIHCHAMFSGLTSDNDVGYLTFVIFFVLARLSIPVFDSGQDRFSR